MTTEALSPTVARLAGDVLAAVFEADPLRATLSGIRDHDGELSDLSEPAERALAERARGLAAAAATVDRSGLGDGDRVSVEVAEGVATQTADLADSRVPEWQVTDLWVAPAASMLIFLPLVTLPEPAHAEAYLRRLGALDGCCAG